MKGVPRWLLLVAAMAAVGPVSIDMYLPGFPAIEREFGVRGVETTMAAYLVGIAVSQLFYGPISDRFGRRPPLYFGFALYALGAAGCALAGSMPALTLMRVVQALGGLTDSVSGLLEDARPPLRQDVRQLGGLAALLARDKDEVEDEIRAIPTLLGRINRTASYGSWFQFYLCDLGGSLTNTDGFRSQLTTYRNDAARCSR